MAEIKRKPVVYTYGPEGRDACWAALTKSWNELARRQKSKLTLTLIVQILGSALYSDGQSTAVYSYINIMFVQSSRKCRADYNHLNC